MSDAATAVEAGNLPPQVKEIVYEETQILERVGELGRQISRDYADCDLMMVGILKGAAPFVCDLARRVTVPVLLDFISVTSYTPTPRRGSVRILKDLEDDVTDRHVLVVEDIVDTGLTLNYLLSLLHARSPASLQVCTLLNRPELRLVELPIRYSGFQVNQEFLIGYGLDYREQHRNLPFIATMKLEGRGFPPGKRS